MWVQRTEFTYLNLQAKSIVISITFVIAHNDKTIPMQHINNIILARFRSMQAIYRNNIAFWQSLLTYLILYAKMLVSLSE